MKVARPNCPMEPAKDIDVSAHEGDLNLLSTSLPHPDMDAALTLE